MCGVHTGGHRAGVRSDALQSLLSSLLSRCCCLAHFLLSLCLSVCLSVSLPPSLPLSCRALARSRFALRTTLSSINSSCSYALTALHHACVHACTAVLPCVLVQRRRRRAVGKMGNAHPKAGKSVCCARAGRPDPARPRPHRSVRASACLCRRACTRVGVTRMCHGAQELNGRLNPGAIVGATGQREIKSMLDLERAREKVCMSGCACGRSATEGRGPARASRETRAHTQKNNLGLTHTLASRNENASS